MSWGSNHSNTRLSRADRWDHALLCTVDLGLAGIIFAAPWFMGGRHPLGAFVLVTLIAATAVAWSLRQCLSRGAPWRRSGVEWLLLAGAGLILFQCVPIPSGWLSKLSPTIYENLTLWAPATEGAFHLGVWNRISLAPHQTQGGLVMFLAYAMLFCVVVQRLEHTEDVQRLLRWIAVATVGMALLGLVQYLAGNGRFLWIYAHPTRDTLDAVKGSFSNQNHFAHLLALGVGPLLWWLQSLSASRRWGESAGFSTGQQRTDRQQLKWLAVAIALGVVSFAGLLSFSRGGIAAMLLAAIVSVFLFARMSLLGRRSLAVLGVMSLVVAVAVFTHGYELLHRKLNTITSARSLDDLSAARLLLWNSLGQAIPDYLVLGTGVGTHREVYPTYFSGFFDREFTHAESGYLQVLLETGLVGMTLLVIGMGICFFWCIHTLVRSRSHSLTACAVAIFAGIFVSALHSIVDFVWYIPACISLTVILAAAACRLNHLAEAGRTAPRDLPTLPRVGWIAVLVFLTGTAGWMVVNRWGSAMSAPHWERYFFQSVRGMDAEVTAINDQDERPLWTSEKVALMRSYLKQSLLHEPQFGRAHLRMAAMCLRQFELEQRNAANAMSLAVIRDAALASSFPTKEAQDRWLDVAIGRNRSLLDHALFHVHRALELCPLQGQGYVYMAELSFLEGSSSASKEAYIAQALRVRPYHGTVLLAAGREAMLAGDLGDALEMWKRAFSQGPEHREAIVEMLGQMPASFFVKHFDLNVDSLRLLFQHYEAQGREDQVREIGRHYGMAIHDQADGEKGVARARLWLRAYHVHKKLGETESAINCLWEALRAAPNDYSTRRYLALRLVDQEQYAEAEQLLRWCLHRKANDSALAKYLKIINREKLRMGQRLDDDGSPRPGRLPR